MLKQIKTSQKTRPIKSAIVYSGLALTLGACATTTNSTACPADVGRGSTVRPIQIVSVRDVNIGPDNSQIGTIVGATAGGLAGSQVGGRGTTQAIGAIGGAVLGGVAGNAVGKAAQTTNGYAYIVRFENGEQQEIIQGPGQVIQPGSAAYVSYRSCGAVISPAA